MLRVLTLNIWNLSGPWRQRRAEIVAWVDRLEPDVVCLQEVVEGYDGRNQARRIAELAAGEWHLAYGGAPSEWYAGGQFGNAVLSRWPIDASHAAHLPHAPAADEVQRLLLHARTHGVDVFCTHLNWRYDNGAMRERQVQRVVEVVEARADPGSPLPPIICGDLNAEPDATEIRFLTGLASLGGRSTYFQDAWRVTGGQGPGWTWDNRNPFAAAEAEPDRRIDYVLVGWRHDDGAGRVEVAQVVCDRALTGTFASDHFGLVADIATTQITPK